MDYLLKGITILHILIVAYQLTYILWRSKQLDPYYMYFSLLIALHWPLLKDECILSYAFKKIKNPNYIAGENPTVLDDFVELKKNLKFDFDIFYVVAPVMTFTFYTILHQTPGFPMPLTVLFIVSWLSYMVILRKLHRWQSTYNQHLIVAVRSIHFIVMLFTAIYYTKALLNQ